MSDENEMNCKELYEYTRRLLRETEEELVEHRRKYNDLLKHHEEMEEYITQLQNEITGLVKIIADPDPKTTFIQAVVNERIRNFGLERPDNA